MPVTSSILSSASAGCGEQGIFSFPYPVIISSSTSPPPPPPTLQMKIFVAGGLRVKTPMITLDGTDTGRHGIRKKRFKTRQNPDMNSGGKVGTSASALGTSLSVGRPRWISPFSILSETVARQKEGREGKAREGLVSVGRTDGRGCFATAAPLTDTATYTERAGRWGMNWGTDHGCAAAVSAAWVIPCLWPKKGTHSREQEVERGGEEGAGKRRSIIGETIYTRRVQLQSGRNFPRKRLGTAFTKSARSASKGY